MLTDEEIDSCCVDRLADELRVMRKDLKAAAEECLVPLPSPGSDLARVVFSNKLLREENERLNTANKILLENRNMANDKVEELSKQVIKPIRTEEEYNVVIKELDSIFGAEEGTPENDRAEVLSMLIEAYENEYYPIEPLSAEELAKEEAKFATTTPEYASVLRGIEDAKAGRVKSLGSFEQYTKEEETEELKSHIEFLRGQIKLFMKQRDMMFACNDDITETLQKQLDTAKKETEDTKNKLLCAEDKVESLKRSICNVNKDISDILLGVSANDNGKTKNKEEGER